MEYVSEAYKEQLEDLAKLLVTPERFSLNEYVQLELEDDSLQH